MATSNKTVGAKGGSTMSKEDVVARGAVKGGGKGTSATRSQWLSKVC